MSVDLSLVICTRNRAPQLAEALVHFARLTSTNTFELVLVDNGSTDETAQLLADFSRTTRLPVRIVYESKPGLSVARNAGCKASSGEIIAFTDDDCYPTVDFIDRIIQCFRESSIGYLGGKVLLYDPSDYPITIQLLDRRIELPPRKYVPLGLIHGANFAFRRQLIEQVGGFDERLGAGTQLKCGEDIDYLTRASGLGWAGAYDPRPKVLHHHRRSKPDEVQRLLEDYDIGRGAYFAKSLFRGQSRSQFLWPVIRRIGGKLIRGDFKTLHRELYGAWVYMKEA